MNSVERVAINEEIPLIEHKRGYEIIKRVQDCTMAIMAIILLAPVWIFIAVVIRLTSPGPAIHKQNNAIGRYGKRITIFKFRTMFVNQDDALHQQAIAQFVQGQSLDTIEKDGEQVAVYKITRDPRVTPIGRFLRKSGLDEIPQLFNVLRGELSLVGPRPPLIYEYEHYTERHKRRLDVLPGITGLYQVTARSQVPFERMIDIDLEYISQRSYWFDLKIIFMTPWVLIIGKGAY